VLEIPVSFLFEDASGSSPYESGMPQDIIDFMPSSDPRRSDGFRQGSTHPTRYPISEGDDAGGR
jgi:hypothetical protein